MGERLREAVYGLAIGDAVGVPYEFKQRGSFRCAGMIGYGTHQQLEQEIASFVGQEEAILFSSGFGANAGILRALLGQNDIALIDPYIHTSAIDRKSTRLNSSHYQQSRMPSSA